MGPTGGVGDFHKARGATTKLGCSQYHLAVAGGCAACPYDSFEAADPPATEAV